MTMTQVLRSINREPCLHTMYIRERNTLLVLASYVLISLISRLHHFYNIFHSFRVYSTSLKCTWYFIDGSIHTVELSSMCQQEVESLAWLISSK